MRLTGDASHGMVKPLIQNGKSSAGKLIENQHGGWSAWLLARVRGAAAGGVASRAAGSLLPPAPPPKTPPASSSGCPHAHRSDFGAARPSGPGARGTGKRVLDAARHRGAGTGMGGVR